MGAEIPKRRKKTARELAGKFGISTRTAVRYMAEPREDYMQRAAARRERVLQLRIQGWKLKDIASDLDISIATAGAIVKKAERSGRLKVSYELAPAPVPPDPNQTQLAI